MTAAAPRLFVVSRPTLDLATVEEFLRSEGTTWRRSDGASAAEELVEVGGRLCYLSFGDHQSPRTNQDYLANLIDRGHESVLEHASWSFILTGISRAFSHQLVRHRIGFAFSQLSQQYHDETEATTVMPRLVRESPAAQAIWAELTEQAREGYVRLLAELERSAPADPDPREQRRAVRSAARSLLPAATETKVLFSANCRALRHFLEVRGDIRGDEEMRVVSALLARVLKAEAPALFSDFEVVELADGLPVVTRSVC